MSSVLGIDLSSFAIDLVRLDEETNAAEWTRVTLGTDKTPALDRLRNVALLMPPPSFYDEVYLAAIEVPYGTGQAGTQAKLNRVFGAVLACLPQSLHVWDVMPGAWRKELGLPGNASKTECAVAVQRLRRAQDVYPRSLEVWPQDALDAYAVAFYARTVNERDALPSPPPVPVQLAL